MLDFDKISSHHILVIGDIMLDRYIFGTVRGKSPEADVPVIDHSHSVSKLGGAANVALNLASLGCQVTLIAVKGDDDNAMVLEAQLDLTDGIKSMLIQGNERKTSTKSRVIADEQHIMRFDEEDRHDLDAGELQDFQQILRSVENNELPDAIVLADYNKGMLSAESISEVLAFAKKHRLKVLVDPKKNNFTAYLGVELFKPNRHELSTWSNLDLQTKEDVIKAMERLQSEIQAKRILVTLGAEGVICLDANGHFQRREALPVDLVDVCGAGDSVISAATIASVQNLSTTELLGVAVAAGALCCEKLGVACLKPEELRRRLTT